VGRFRGSLFNLSVLISCLLCALVSGCVHKPDLSSLSAQPLVIRKYLAGGQSEERRVSPPSKVHEGFAGWANKHTDGWKTTYITYAPRLLVSGTNFSLNVLESGVILNIQGRQYVRDGSAAEFGFLTDALK
jgi:hypothetical protein